MFDLLHIKKRIIAPCPWWRHEMETFSALLAICGENSPVPGDFPTQRPVKRSFHIFFDLRLNKGWVNNRGAGDLRRHRAHYGVIVMQPAEWPTDWTACFGDTTWICYKRAKIILSPNFPCHPSWDCQLILPSWIYIYREISHARETAVIFPNITDAQYYSKRFNFTRYVATNLIQQGH